MAKTREKKALEIERSKAKFDATKSVVLADLSTLKVSDSTELRRRAKTEQVSVVTLKKTLLRRALKDAGIAGVDEESLKGGVTLLYGMGDEIAPAKLVAEFKKTNDKVKILGGLLESNWMSANQVQALAQLPSKEQLIASVVGSIRAPLTGLVGVLQGNLRSLVYALNAIKDAKS
jgi:large subunit ribosomal protein L10